MWAPLCLLLTVGPAAVTAETGHADTPCPSRRSTVAWTLLAQGRQFESLRHFARQADLFPENGNPKLGYALAAATAGDLSRGERAMRRVLRTDPAALRDLDLADELRPLVVRLASLYSERHDDDRDAAMMLCALYYVLRHEDSTLFAVELVMANGETGPAASKLRQLVGDWLQPPPPPVPPPVPAPDPVSVPATMAPLVEASATPVPEAENALPTDASAWELPDPSAATEDPPPVTPQPIPQQFPIDYDKLGEDLTNVGNALGGFTRRLLKVIAETSPE